MRRSSRESPGWWEWNGRAGLVVEDEANSGKVFSVVVLQLRVSTRVAHSAVSQPNGALNTCEVSPCSELGHRVYSDVVENMVDIEFERCDLVSKSCWVACLTCFNLDDPGDPYAFAMFLAKRPILGELALGLRRSLVARDTL